MIIWWLIGLAILDELEKINKKLPPPPPPSPEALAQAQAQADFGLMIVTLFFVTLFMSVGLFVLGSRLWDRWRQKRVDPPDGR